MDQTRPLPPSAPGIDLVRIFLFAWVLLFGGFAALSALSLPIDNNYDEIQHYSFIRELWAHPTLFPAYGQYRILAGDLATWTAEPNYLSHPALYYLLTGPLTALFPGQALPIRLFDVALVMTGLVFACQGLLHRMPGFETRVLLVALVFALSESTKMAALINNDDLLVCETGLLIWARAGQRHRPVLVALLLAAIGWTKFNGFVAAALFLGLAHLSATLHGREKLFGRTGLLLLAGVAVGALPALAVFHEFGRLVWVPERFPDWFNYATPEEKAVTTIWTYGRWFGREIGRRFPFQQSLVDVMPLLLVFLGLALSALRPAAARAPDDADIARSGVVTTLAFALIIWLYGWRNFTVSSILSEAQPRYFIVAWFPFVFAVTLGVAALPRPLVRPVALILLAAVIAVSTPLFPLFAAGG